MFSRFLLVAAASLAALGLVTSGCRATALPQGPGAATAAGGWPSWRGPDQNGSSSATGLPTSLAMPGDHASWTYELSGRGTPVIHDGRVYTLGYRGEGKELEEVLACLDERTGTLLWQRSFQHFLTDVIYYRFAIGSPTIDPATGNVFCLTSAGLFCSFTATGELRWQHAMMSEFGKLSFPNGRTGSPIVDGELAIVHVATSGWGPQGPARDRFFAFDKHTGECVWTSTPGGPPKDTSFSMPVLAWQNGRRVLYAGLAGGNLACVDVRTGEALWRFPMCTGGMSSSAVLYQDTVIAVHGKENLDSSTAGRMVAIQCGDEPGPDGRQLVLGQDRERWRNDLTAFTSSPVLVGNRVYLTDATGELACVDADRGTVLWQHKLAPDQIHASPAYGDGRLWVPMNNGSFFVVEPSDDGAKVLAEKQLDGNCLGAPAIANGRVYVHTTKALYCFAGPGSSDPATATVAADPVSRTAGPATQLQVIPADIVVRQGDRVQFRARSLDARGATAADPVAGDVTWSGQLQSGITIDDQGLLVLTADATPSVAVLKATVGELSATARLRVVPNAPHTDDFDDAVLAPHPTEQGVTFARPRPYWIGANLKWEIRELDGEKVLARTLDQPLFQRTITMIGHPDQADYTIQADVRSDGNRRSMSSGGVINQRYLIVLKGNHQELEVTSNEELLKERVPFQWRPGVWYRLKSRVDNNPDGSGVVRAKAWPRDQAEPAAWTIEVTVPNASRHGSPGLYGFTPQSRFRVYLDNITVTPND